jgi:hypothetical protein
VSRWDGQTRPERMGRRDSGSMIRGIVSGLRTEGSWMANDRSSVLMTMIPPAPELIAFMAIDHQMSRGEEVGR